MKRGPVDCKGCHVRNHTDHEALVRLSTHPTPSEVTEECLRCHEKVGRDLLTSSHWLWRGPSPYTVGHRGKIGFGKGTATLNNF
jgi:hypothetical protein